MNISVRWNDSAWNILWSLRCSRVESNTGSTSISDGSDWLQLYLCWIEDWTDICCFTQWSMNFPHYVLMRKDSCGWLSGLYNISFVNSNTDITEACTIWMIERALTVSEWCFKYAIKHFGTCCYIRKTINNELLLQHLKWIIFLQQRLMECFIPRANFYFWKETHLALFVYL